MRLATKKSLEEIRELVHSDHFWLNRKGESFVKVYGGSYVLGQQQNDLHLVLGSNHTALTDRICKAHNLVYTAIHLEVPASPGFNTLIFGCNLTGSGFHYHQDSIASLDGKNAPLVPTQPVVTTVIYEKEEDDGKETVLWKPLLNFNPLAAAARSSPTPQVADESGGDVCTRNPSLYLAARAITTQNGQVHVQRAGLQSVAQHGIFHTPTAAGQGGARTGWRLAITARICHANSKERIGRYMDLYKGVLGPEGNMTMPRRVAG